MEMSGNALHELGQRDTLQTSPVVVIDRGLGGSFGGTRAGCPYVHLYFL